MVVNYDSSDNEDSDNESHDPPVKHEDGGDDANNTGIVEDVLEETRMTLASPLNH